MSLKYPIPTGQKARKIQWELGEMRTDVEPDRCVDIVHIFGRNSEHPIALWASNILTEEFYKIRIDPPDGFHRSLHEPPA